MRPSQTILVLEDLEKTSLGPLYRKGVELSSIDSQTVKEVYQQWLLLALDLGYLHHDTLDREVRRLWSDMITKDVLDLNSCFAELLHLVRCKSNKGFKALCGGISSHLYSFVKDDIERISQGDVLAGKRLVQLFAYTSRLTLSKIDLSQQCLEDYMEIEDNMSTYLPKSLISSLNKIIRRWMTSFDPENLNYSHGPGGVAGHGRIALEAKYKDLTSDALLCYAFGDPYWAQSPIPSTLDRISQTVFVPKSYKTFRTISMEPSTLIYLQKGVQKEIDRVVNSSRYLRSHIGTKDQTRNQLLAKEGAFSRNYATIDLSAASDSVSYALVKELFRGTKLLRFLVASRSHSTLLPDGRLIELKKFAPMGSALCFPVETIIFAAICQYVTREHGVTTDYSVYGDDIIVPTQCAEDVMITLNILGFSVNREKSFYDPQCWFRESCGGEYCDGFDVTPMKVSREYNHVQTTVKTTGLIDLANLARTKGFVNLRHFFIRKLRKTHFNVFFSPIALNSDNYTNYQTKRRWNPGLQRIEAYAFGQKTSYDDKIVQDETVRYRHWLESTKNRLRLIDGFTSEIRRSTVSIQDAWREKPYESLDQDFIDHFTLSRG